MRRGSIQAGLAFRKLQGAFIAAQLAVATASPVAALPVAAGSPLINLAAERESYLLGEPIYLRMESQRAPVPSLEEGSFLLAIQAAGEPEWIYHPPLRYRAGPAKYADTTARARDGVPMHSDPERIRFARIICADGELVFRKPGRYRLRLIALPSAEEPGAKRAAPPASGPVVSDTLTVSFRDPSSAADKKAYSILARNPGEYGLALYLEGGDQLRDGMAIIAELAASQSAYTRAASFVLSSDWSQDFNDYAGGLSRPIDLQKALAWAQWDKGNGAYIPIRNAYRLAAAADLVSNRSGSVPGLAAVRARLASFLASLSANEAAWLKSF